MKEDTFMYIPLLDTLALLLQNKTLRTEVHVYTITFMIHVTAYLYYYLLLQIEHGHASAEEQYEDFCDGEFFKSHPLFSVHCNSLQLQLYYDNVEICNPLGLSAKSTSLVWSPNQLPVVYTDLSI